MKFKVPWRLIYEEADQAVYLALRNSINSPSLAKIVVQAAAAAFLAVITQYLVTARAIIDQIKNEKRFLDTELEEKLREKQQQSVRLKQPLKVWTIFDGILVVFYLGCSGGGMVIEWNAVTQLLMASDPMGHHSFFRGLTASGIILLAPVAIKAAAPSILDNSPANRRFLLGLFLVSLPLVLVWVLCFAALTDKTSLNSLATQLVSPVINPNDEEFKRILFFTQMVSQALASALISGFLFLKAENIIRTHRRRKNLRNEILISGTDVGLDDIQSRHRSMTGAAAQAQAVIDEVPSRKESFVRGWLTQAEAATRAKAALEDIIGPFTIVPKDH
jgi:hypothetical protein